MERPADAWTGRSPTWRWWLFNELGHHWPGIRTDDGARARDLLGWTGREAADAIRTEPGSGASRAAWRGCKGPLRRRIGNTARRRSATSSAPVRSHPRGRRFRRWPRGPPGSRCGGWGPGVSSSPGNGPKAPATTSCVAAGSRAFCPPRAHRTPEPVVEDRRQRRVRGVRLRPCSPGRAYEPFLAAVGPDRLIGRVDGAGEVCHVRRIATRRPVPPGSKGKTQGKWTYVRTAVGILHPVPQVCC